MPRHRERVSNTYRAVLSITAEVQDVDLFGIWTIEHDREPNRVAWFVKRLGGCHCHVLR